MGFNVHSLTAAGFATCEVQRSETQQVAKPADVQADVTATIINKIVIKKRLNFLIFTHLLIRCQVVIF